MNRERKYRDASTGQYTTAADAANRPAETVAETATTRHETPDVAELRALAEDADAGPWGQTDYYDEDDGCVCHLVHSGDADQFRVALGLQEYNAAFIAAANPAVVLALLAERAALAARLAAAEVEARAQAERAVHAEKQADHETRVAVHLAGIVSGLRAKIEGLRAVHARYFDLDGRPGYDDTNPEPEDVWRFDRDFRRALDEEPQP